MDIIQLYKDYIQREKQVGNITENDGEVAMILDLHNRNKKNMNKKFKDYSRFPWNEFKEEVLRSVKHEPKVIHSDNMCYVVQYGLNDYQEYKKRYDNKTKWCTTSKHNYEDYVGELSYLYVLHNVRNGHLYQCSTDDLKWYNSQDVTVEATMNQWLLDQVLESILKIDQYVLIRKMESKELYLKYHEMRSHIAIDVYHGKVVDSDTGRICKELLFKYPKYGQYMMQCYCAGIIDVYIYDDDITYDLSYHVPTRYNVPYFIRLVPYGSVVYAFNKFPNMRDELVTRILMSSRLDIIKHLMEDGYLTRERVISHNDIRLLHKLGMYDVPYYPLYSTDWSEINDHQQDKIIPMTIAPYLEKYYPNHPDYENVLAGKYDLITDKKNLMHFNSTIRYPPTMIKNATKVHVCSGLPKEYIITLCENGHIPYENEYMTYIDQWEGTVKTNDDPRKLTDRDLDHMRDNKSHTKLTDFKSLVKENHRIVRDIMLCSYTTLELIYIIGLENVNMI